ncbi:MAG: 50S ribosomal protein L4 [uncultured bacterium]|nr:MAG: 50S ribosomal protein L4 [uncultured bacterium]
MIKVKRYDNLGKELDALQLNDKIFGLKINNDLIHQAVVTQLANARQSSAHSKTRSEVAGSGKKPWRQKGTGRARSGSVRNPIWVGGGINFGPRNVRNYSLNIPKKMKRSALFQALTAKVAENKFIIVDEINFKSPKTKLAVKLIESLPSISGTILVVNDKTNVKVELAFKNLPYVKTILARNLNIIDVLKYNWIIASSLAVKEIESVFLKIKDSNLNKDENNEDSKVKRTKKEISVKKSVKTKKNVKN